MLLTTSCDQGTERTEGHGNEREPSSRPDLLPGCGSYKPVGQYKEDATAIRAEEANIQKLTKDMLKELMALDPSLHPDTLDAETHRWFLARMDHCKTCCTQAHQALDELEYLRCLKWAAACRLELLLTRYDSLVSLRDAQKAGARSGAP